MIPRCCCYLMKARFITPAGLAWEHVCKVGHCAMGLVLQSCRSPIVLLSAMQRPQYVCTQTRHMILS